MFADDLLSLLRCPACLRDGQDGALDLVRDRWLVCRSCGRKYPIHDDIPILLIEEGDKHIETPVEQLRVVE